MAYEHDGLAAALELVDRLHHGRLVEGIERAGGLVEQDERRVVEEDARKADALALAARERVAQLGDGRVETLRQAVDEGAKRSGAASVEQLGIGGAGVRNQQILAYGAAEQMCVLGHIGLVAA